MALEVRADLFKHRKTSSHFFFVCVCSTFLTCGDLVHVPVPPAELVDEEEGEGGGQERADAEDEFACG